MWCGRLGSRSLSLALSPATVINGARQCVTARRAAFGRGGLKSLSGKGSSGPLGKGSRRPLGKGGAGGGRSSSNDAGSSPPPRSLPGKAKLSGPAVAIVGGGLSGLACGWALQRRRIRAVVFDTGKRGPGGRASSRVLEAESGTHIVDHAVQSFTAKGPEVRELVREMERDGAVRKWEGRVGTLGSDGAFRQHDEELWIGNEAKGMASVSSWLARRLEMHQDVWVARLARPDSGGWALQDQKRKPVTNESYAYVVMAHNGKCADRLIKTSPLRTSAHAPLRCRFVAEPSAGAGDRLELSSLWVCVVAAPPGVAAFDGAFVEGSKVLSWVGNNASKYSAGHGAEAWTIISTPQYGKANKCSQEFIPDDVRRRVSGELRAAFGALLGANAQAWPVLHLQLWGAALPLNVCPQNFVHDADARLGVCGDWLSSPSVEGALFSGLALAGAIERELVGDGMADTGVQPFHAFAGGHAIGAFGAEAELTVEAALEANNRPRMWNFAFGANVNPWKLKAKRGIQPVEEVPGYLPGWRLVFNHSGGMGNIEPLAALEDAAGPNAVHGMLLLLEPEDFSKLSAMEHEYKTEEVEVTAYDGRVIKALAYVSPPDYRLPSYPAPPERYIKLIRQGAAKSKLQRSYQEWLGSVSGVAERGPEYWDHKGYSRRKLQQQRRRQVAGTRA